MVSTKEYLDFVLEQLSELDEISCRAMMCARIHRKCLRQNATNAFGKMPQMSSARIENGCESSIMMYIYFFFKR